MEQQPELELLKNIPGFKIILRTLMKDQMKYLAEQLSKHAGEETLIVTASVSEGTSSHLSSHGGKDFLENRDEIKSQFLGHCIKNSRVPHGHNSQTAVNPTPSQHPPTPTSVGHDPFNNIPLNNHLSLFTRPSPAVHPVSVYKTALESTVVDHSERQDFTRKLPSSEAATLSQPPLKQVQTYSVNGNSVQEPEVYIKIEDDSDDENIPKIDETSIVSLASTNVVEDEPYTCKADGVHSSRTNPPDEHYETNVIHFTTAGSDRINIAPLENFNEEGQLGPYNGSVNDDNDSGNGLNGVTSVQVENFEVENIETIEMLQSSLSNGDADVPGIKLESTHYSDRVEVELFPMPINNTVTQTAEKSATPKNTFRTVKRKESAPYGKESLFVKRSSSLECTICGTLFKTMSSLRRHTRKHTGDNPWSCSLCGKSFYRKDDLNTHILKHEGRKPYYCHICGTGLCKKTQLKMHLHNKHNISIATTM